ncbi:hypothetical protein HKD37_06G015294 [Glycine soja]
MPFLGTLLRLDTDAKNVHHHHVHDIQPRALHGVVTDLVTTVALVALRPSDRKRRRKGIETERPKSVATVAYEVFRQ